MSALSNLAKPNWFSNALRIDRVIAVTLVIAVALFIYDQSHGVSALLFTAKSLVETAPFLLLSVGVAAYARASDADNLISRAFTGHPIPMVFTAAAFGALSPFCSCGVIPIIAALLTMGVPLAPVMAFWLASPIMDPSMFALTTAVLGLDYAIAKTLAAIAIGLLGGFGIMALGKFALFADPLREGVGDGGCGASTVRTQKPVIWKFWQDPARIEKFRKSAMTNAFFLGKWLTLAFLLEYLMLTFIPAELIASVLSGTGVAPIALATIVGVPAYLNGYAALPLVSGLLDQGMAPGAAVAFMVAGGVTCIPAVVAVFALVKRPVFISYLVFALIGSFAAGLAFQAFMVA